MINSPVAQSVLVFATNLGKAFQTRNQSTSDHLLIFGGVALAIAAILAALVVWDRRRKQGRVKSDAELILFRRLCRLHALKAADVNLLTQLAESRSPQLKSAVFVDPRILDARVDEGGRHAERYAELRAALFGGIH